MGVLTIVSTYPASGGGGGGGPLALAFSGNTAAFEIAYTGFLIATGGSGTYTYSITTGLSAFTAAGFSLNSSTGKITGTPGVITVLDFTGSVTDTTPSTATCDCKLVIATLPTPGATVGDEWGNCTLSSVGPVFSVNAGVEQWQALADGTASPGSSFPAFGQGQGVLCACAVLSANIASWSSAAAVNITVRPWYVSRTCTTNGTSTITAISPAVNPGAANVATNGFVLVGTQAYSIASWNADGTGCVLNAELPSGTTWPTTGTGVAFATLEFRYGGISNGDTIWISDGTNAYKFTLNTISLNLSATGTSTWNVTPQASTGSGITASSTTYILDITINTIACDAYAGTMPLGTTTAVSPPYNIGAPAAYLYLLVGENVYGQQNTWPVLGQTPGLTGTPFGVEYQQPGTFDTVQVPPGVTDNNNILVNGSFEFTTYGVTSGVTTTTLVPSTWCPFQINYLTGRSILDPTGALSDRLFNSVGGTSSGYTSGNLVLKLIALNYEVVSNFTTCKPGQQFTFYVAACGNSGVPTLRLALGFFAGDGVTFISSVTATETLTTSWVQYSLTATVPAGASYVYVTFTVGSSGTINSGNAIWVDNAQLYQSPASGNALGLDTYGNTILKTQSLTIGYFNPGNSPTFAGSFSIAAYTGGSPAVTNSSTSLTITTSLGGNSLQYWFVTGPGIQPGTYVVGNSGTGVTLSLAASIPSTLGTTLTGGEYVFVQLPLPSSTAPGGGSYPVGCYVFNENTGGVYPSGRIYRLAAIYSSADSWIDGADPGDLLAGIAAIGVVYAGVVNVGQLTAGTATFSGTVTFANGSGPQVQITSTDVILSSGGGLASVDISASLVTVNNGSLEVSGSASTCTVGTGGITVSTVGGGSAILTPSELNVSSLPALPGSGVPGGHTFQFYYNTVTGIVVYDY